MIALSTEQRLALAFGETRFQARFSVLLQFDRNLGRAVQQESAPIAGQLRLAWWRNQIAAFPNGQSAIPVLSSLSEFVRDRELAKETLTRIVDAWEILLGDGDLSDECVIQYANERGGGLFRLAANLAQTVATEDIAEAGTLWALVDFARHCTDPALAKHIFELARVFLGSARQVPRLLRPFAILAHFAERDVVRGFDRMVPAGSPRRIAQAWKFSLGVG